MGHRRPLPFALAILLIALAGPVLAESPKPAEGKEITLPSGLRYTDIKTGDGEEAKLGQIVTIHYTGWLTNGTKIDSTFDRGQPLSFRLGDANQVIEGWNKGIVGMKVGGKRKLVIPPGLAYSGQSIGGIVPPNSTLVFEIELLGVK